MGAVETWTIAEQTGLAERGQPLFMNGPLELQNAHSLNDGVLEMRQGFAVEDLTGSNLANEVQWVGRHVTATGTEELWAVDQNTFAHRVGASWTPVAFSNTPNTSNLRFTTSAILNGKLFLAYDSNVDRLHVWDGTSLRRVGLATATAPTVASIGAGGLAFTRYYRQRNTFQSGGVTLRRSEPSSSVNITIAASSGVRVTKGAVSGDGETHWEVEAAAAAAGPWYRIATVVVGTTTYDDTSATIDTTNPSAVAGLYTVPGSAKYLATDGSSLFMAGNWEGGVQNRVWFTPPLGTLDVGDDERIPTANYIDIGDAGPITALSGPLGGEMHVFKALSRYKLVPTGDLTTPYRRIPFTFIQGAVDQRLVTEGEFNGEPTIFFADLNYVYAMTSGGVSTISEKIGRDLRARIIVADPGLLKFAPDQRVLFLQTTTAPVGPAGSYDNFLLDTVKGRWSGFLGAGSGTGWLLGVSLLGIGTYLGGTGATIIHGAYAAGTDGTRRLFVGGQTSAGAAQITSFGGQVLLDGTLPFETAVRYRKVPEVGKLATFKNPSVWYRNPQGTVSGTLSMTVTYIPDGNDLKALPQTVTLEATDRDSGIGSKRLTLESLYAADCAFLDVRVTLSYSGTPFTSAVTPAIDAICIPYQIQEPLAR